MCGWRRSAARRPPDLRRALQQLRGENVRGLIVDLRFNPGGLLSAAIEVSNLFISSGPHRQHQGPQHARTDLGRPHDGAFEGFPMVVLVNRYSASASEIVSACLQDHQRAVLMGERTWGKGSVQNVIDMEDGRSALKLTTAPIAAPAARTSIAFPTPRTPTYGASCPTPATPCG